MFWTFTCSHLMSMLFLLCMVMTGMNLFGIPATSHFMFVQWLGQLNMSHVSTIVLFVLCFFGFSSLVTVLWMTLELGSLWKAHMFVWAIQGMTTLAGGLTTSVGLTKPVGHVLLPSISLGSAQLLVWAAVMHFVLGVLLCSP